MHKFTIFTIILSAVVILLTAELVVNDYWDSEAESMQASVLTVEGEPKIDEEIEQDIVEEPIEEALPYFEETFLDWFFINNSNWWCRYASSNIYA